MEKLIDILFSKATLAFICTMVFSFIAWKIRGEFVIPTAIATMGAFIVHAIEKTKE